MKLSRRQSLKYLGAAAASGILPNGVQSATLTARQKTQNIFLSCNANTDGKFNFAALNPDGTCHYEIPLPGRGHGVAVRRDQAVVIARRPGNFAIVTDLISGSVVQQLTAPTGRHFFGHGSYSTDGKKLYTTENDFDAGRGVVGVWDAENNYRRLGEYPSYGIGPHEIIPLSGGKTLAVANGGLLTHPDTGRRKLNIPTMISSLVYLDGSNGRLIKKHRFDKSRYRKLSVRHISEDRSGAICIALQDQGPKEHLMPLVAFHQQDQPYLKIAPTPSRVTRRLRGYMGSSAIDQSGVIAAVSAPRGNMVTFWDTRNRNYLGRVKVFDCCGIAAFGSTGIFIITSGGGGVILHDVITENSTSLNTSYSLSRRWDNHITVAGI